VDQDKMTSKESGSSRLHQERHSATQKFCITTRQNQGNWPTKDITHLRSIAERGGCF